MVNGNRAALRRVAVDTHIPPLLETIMLDLLALPYALNVVTSDRVLDLCAPHFSVK